MIEPCKSSWACSAFYINKHSKQKREKKGLVINYKALNEALEPIRYHLPNKDILLATISGGNELTNLI